MMKIYIKIILLNYISKLILTLDDKLNTPFQNYLSESIRYALTYDTEEYFSLVNETIDYLLSLIPLEISKTWTKMISYLDIFDTLLNMHINLANLHNKIVKIFFEKDMSLIFKIKNLLYF